MIDGYFDPDGRPYLQARLIIPRLEIDDLVDFLVDTGADVTTLHSADAQRVGCRFDRLENRYDVAGIGGLQDYYQETASVILPGAGQLYRVSGLEIDVAKPDAAPRSITHYLPSLIGNDLLDHLRMDYRRRARTLVFYPLG